MEISCCREFWFEFLQFCFFLYICSQSQVFCFNTCMFSVVYPCLFVTLFYDRPVGWCYFLYVFSQAKQNRVIAKVSLREYYFAIEVTLHSHAFNVFWLWALKFWSIFMHACLFRVFLIHVFSDVIHHDRNILCLIDTIYCCSFLVLLLAVQKKQNQVSSIILSILVIIFMV